MTKKLKPFKKDPGPKEEFVPGLDAEYIRTVRNTIPVKQKNGQIIERPKIHVFLEEFLKNGGNATAAAAKISKTKNRHTAAEVARLWMKKARDLGMIYLDEKGMGYGRLLDVAILKMLESKTPEFWDRLMKIGGYEDFLSKDVGSSVAVNIFQDQEKIRREFGFSDSEIVEGEEVDEDIQESGQNQKV